MSKNIILAGKEYNKSSKIAQLAKQNELNAFVTKTFEKSEETPTPSIYDWNRSSPVSARSIVVNAENQFGTIDGAALFFDAASFNSHFTQLSIEEANKASDELILSYTYLALELLKRIERKDHGKIFFILQKMQTSAEFLRSSSREQIANPAHASAITAMAQAAFKAFAENLAASKYKETKGSFIYLLEVNSETTEEQIIQWLAKKIEEDDPIYKNSKNAVSWQTTEEKSKFTLPFMR
ncbi:MAG: hypothetical protein K5839_00780 [Treponemataceae bacterium]|nr:hypothetical protein [Treponemataceae bacterium]